MPLIEVIDGAFGDGGKGVLTSYIAIHDNPYAVGRAGSPSAGHSSHLNGKKYFFQQIPSGVFNPDTQLLIGVGAFVDPTVVLREVETYKEFNIEQRLRIDENATLIFQEHKDREAELKKRVGSVGSGVGPACSDRVMRREGILVKDEPRLRQYSEGVDVGNIIRGYLKEGRLVVLEGSHGSWLSNCHGTYPNTNAYNNTASALLDQMGLGPKKVDEIIVVFKSFVTRVGEGPLIGQLSEEECNKRGWVEYGTVSGRRRRAAPFNVDYAKRSVELNDATQLAFTRMDTLFPEVQGVTEYDELSRECRRWLEEREKELDVPITLIKTGPEIRDVIDLRAEKRFA